MHCHQERAFGCCKPKNTCLPLRYQKHSTCCTPRCSKPKPVGITVVGAATGTLPASTSPLDTLWSGEFSAENGYESRGTQPLPFETNRTNETNFLNQSGILTAEEAGLYTVAADFGLAIHSAERTHALALYVWRHNELQPQIYRITEQANRPFAESFSRKLWLEAGERFAVVLDFGNAAAEGDVAGSAHLSIRADSKDKQKNVQKPKQ